MKTSKYIFLSLAAAFVATACNQEMNPDNPNKANPGDEVQFGLSLPGNTKTVYGEETSTGFPIYWVNGDKVKVASPQCMSGRNSAEYSVNTKNPETGEVKVDQNYATSLDKTGDAGVQWGEAEEADFYSIYPSSTGELTINNDNTISAKFTVAATQFANTKESGAMFYSQPAEMGNVIMYAKTTAKQSDEAVVLHYTPFSTVIEFELNAPDEEIADKVNTLTIQSITLTAPAGKTIAGDFDFSFDGPSVTPRDGGSNAITMHFLDNNQYNISLIPSKPTMKAKMCLMPVSGIDDLSGWKVEVATSVGTFSKNLTADTGALKPGLVHKIHLPKLSYATKEWVYDPTGWLPSLPDYRNIYLSEISLPGAWYAGSTEAYQATSKIADLWDVGVRAFGVETRTIVSGNSAITLGTVPEGISISGTGIINSSRNKTGGSNSLNADTSNKKSCGAGNSLSTIISNIAAKVKNSDEYAVLVLSYADGGSGGHRAVDYGAWLQLLYDTFNNLSSDVKSSIYQTEITANTTVNDVVGKVILKINVDSYIAMEGSVRYWGDNNFKYENNLPALFSYNPFLFQMNESDKYSVPFFSNLSWSSWGDDTSTHRSYFKATAAQSMANPFLWCFSSANRTQVDNGTNGTIPKYSQRQSVLGAMMTYSKQIYDASTHNVWFYFNCGGTETESQTSETSSTAPTNFAKKMNPWLLERIQIKSGDKADPETGLTSYDPSPLGIVMFNQCTNTAYSGPAIIDAIIRMNSMFYLKHAGTSGGSTGGSTGGSESQTAQNDVLVTNGGDAI